MRWESVTGEIFELPDGVPIPVAEAGRITGMPPGPGRDAALAKFSARLTSERDGRRRMERAEAAFDNTAPLRYGVTCYQTYPCQHDVRTPSDQLRARWSGVRIARWFLEHRYPLPPHFQCYVTATDPLVPAPDPGTDMATRDLATFTVAGGDGELHRVDPA